MPLCRLSVVILLAISTLGICAKSVVSFDSDQPSRKISVYSTGPGQWVGYSSEPLSFELLNELNGKYMLSGSWPAGVNSPDSPLLLLGRQRLASTRIAEVKLESGGRIIQLTTDPVTSPEPHNIAFGKTILSATCSGFAALFRPEEAVESVKKTVIPYPMTYDGLNELAKVDPNLKSFQSAWLNSKSTLKLQSWLRLAEGVHNLQFVSDREFKTSINGEETHSVASPEGFKLEMKVESAGIEQEMVIEFPETSKPITNRNFLKLSQITMKGSESIKSDLESSHILVPWAPESPPEAVIAIAPPPYDLTGGDAIKGREVFNSSTAKCSTCHAIDGQGGKIGPDLTGLRGKSPELVFHHINAPSDRIHPGYPSFSLALKGGQVSMGVIHSISSVEMEIVDTDAKSLKFNVSEIEEIRPSSSSIMPSGLAGTIGEPAMRDLIAFLTGEVKSQKSH